MSINKNKIIKLHKLHEQVQGTIDFNKFRMECETIINKKSWKYWKLPEIDVPLNYKVIDNKEYLISDDGDKYLLTKAVKEVLI